MAIFDAVAELNARQAEGAPADAVPMPESSVPGRPTKPMSATPQRPRTPVPAGSRKGTALDAIRIFGAGK